MRSGIQSNTFVASASPKLESTLEVTRMIVDVK
jgi:hypothetical protein